MKFFVTGGHIGPPLHIVLSLLIFSGCLTTEYNPATNTSDLMMYSTDKEMSMGHSIDRGIAKEYKLSQDPRVLERVNRIGAAVAAVCDRQEIPYYFRVINDDEMINAFAIPGGYVYISSALLNILSSDDQVAFVLAHEVGHIAARHSIKRLQAALGANLLLLGSTQVESSGNLAPIQGLSLILSTVFSGYSQEDELLADSLAVEYTRKAGFDPAAGIDVMELLDAENKKQPRPLTYFRSHPYGYQRTRNIKEKLGLPLGIEDIIN
jgi:predicted Zn-dependent protease